MSKHFGDEVLIRTDGYKLSYLNGLTKFLQALALDAHYLRNRNGVIRPSIFFQDESLAYWDEDRARLFRDALAEVIEWPRPGKTGAVGTAWEEFDGTYLDPEDSDYYKDDYRKATPKARRAFVETARNHVHGVVQP